MSPPFINTQQHRRLVLRIKRTRNDPQWTKNNELKADGKVNLLVFGKDVVDVLIFLPQELHQLVIA